MDDAIKRLHLSDINQRTVVLPAVLTESEGTMQLVKFLGFHFQPQNEHFSEPYVIFPHWNHDELLIPAFESLRAINGMFILFIYIFCRIFNTFSSNCIVGKVWFLYVRLES